MPSKTVLTNLAISATLALGLSLSASNFVSAAESLSSTVSIGALLPLTGNAGFIGEEARQGLDIFLSEYEKVRPAQQLPKLDFIFVDSQADPRIGLQGYQLLRSKHDVQVVYLTYTSVAIAAAPTANRDKTAMLNMTQGEVTKLGPYFTSTLPAYSMQGEVVTKEAVRRGVKTISLLYENSEAFVAEAQYIERTVCPKLGCKAVVSAQIPGGSTDVAAQVTAALAPAPDAVFPIGIATQLVPIARELQTRGYKGQIIGVGDMGGVVAAGNANLIEGAIYTTFAFDETNPDMKRYSDAYKAKFNKAPSQYVSFGYQTGQIVASVVKTMKEQKLDWNGPNFVAAQKKTVADTIAGKVSFLADGRIAEPMVLVRIQNGKPETLRKILPDELKE